MSKIIYSNPNQLSKKRLDKYRLNYHDRITEVDQSVVMDLFPTVLEPIKLPIIRRASYRYLPIFQGFSPQMSILTRIFEDQYYNFEINHQFWSMNESNNTVDCESSSNLCSDNYVKQEEYYQNLPYNIDNGYAKREIKEPTFNRRDSNKDKQFSVERNRDKIHPKKEMQNIYQYLKVEQQQEVKPQANTFLKKEYRNQENLQYNCGDNEDFENQIELQTNINNNIITENTRKSIRKRKSNKAEEKQSNFQLKVLQDCHSQFSNSEIDAQIQVIKLKDKQFSPDFLNENLDQQKSKKDKKDKCFGKERKRQKRSKYYERLAMKEAIQNEEDDINENYVQSRDINIMGNLIEVYGIEESRITQNHWLFGGLNTKSIEQRKDDAYQYLQQMTKAKEKHQYKSDLSAIETLNVCSFILQTSQIHQEIVSFLQTPSNPVICSLLFDQQDKSRSNQIYNAQSANQEQPAQNKFLIFQPSNAASSNKNTNPVTSYNWQSNHSPLQLNTPSQLLESSMKSDKLDSSTLEKYSKLYLTSQQPIHLQQIQSQQSQPCQSSQSEQQQLPLAISPKLIPFQQKSHQHSLMKEEEQQSTNSSEQEQLLKQQLREMQEGKDYLDQQQQQSSLLTQLPSNQLKPGSDQISKQCPLPPPPPYPAELMQASTINHISEQNQQKEVDSPSRSHQQTNYGKNKSKLYMLLQRKFNNQILNATHDSQLDEDQQNQPTQKELLHQQQNQQKRIKAEQIFGIQSKKLKSISVNLQNQEQDDLEDQTDNKRKTILYKNCKLQKSNSQQQSKGSLKNCTSEFDITECLFSKDKENKSVNEKQFGKSTESPKAVGSTTENKMDGHQEQSKTKINAVDYSSVIRDLFRVQVRNQVNEDEFDFNNIKTSKSIYSNTDPTKRKFGIEVMVVNSEDEEVQVERIKKNYGKFHNFNKLFMYNIVKMFSEYNLDNLSVPQILIQEIQNITNKIKVSARRRNNSNKEVQYDYFSIAHYNLLFYQIHQFNTGVISSHYEYIHFYKKCFQIDIQSNSRQVLSMTYANIVKRFCYMVYIYSINKSLTLANESAEKTPRQEYIQKVTEGIQNLQKGMLVRRF